VEKRKVPTLQLNLSSKKPAMHDEVLAELLKKRDV